MSHENKNIRTQLNTEDSERGNSHLEAWIDVGGTFTDCFVRLADGRLHRGKTLSSGHVPVSLGGQNSETQWYLPELKNDCEQFWAGSHLACYTNDGTQIWKRRISSSSEGLVDFVESERQPVEFGKNLLVHPGVEAPVLGVHRLLQIPLQQQLPRINVRLGTTRGTNALLTRTGAKTAFATTSPFRDLLKIGDQTRPNLFDLAIELAEPLAEHVIEVTERLDPDGNIVTALEQAAAAAELRDARDAGFESLAICLMHSYRNPVHEQLLARIASEVGFKHISISSRLAPVIEFVARAQTTVVDAYLSPIIRDYLEQLIGQFGGPHRVLMSVMTSAGGLDAWQNYSGKDCILSGPAGGVAALRGIAQATARPALIGLDMGGTSTDVCRVAEDQELQYASTKAGVRILTPTLPIETVASGGGSICWFDGVSLRVGPQSAGATPGPACYGQGGPLTITDVNVFLGHLPPSQFPFALELESVNRRLNEAFAQANPMLQLDSIKSLAQGFRTIANEQMADAVRTVSIAQGTDPRAHTLVGFGGAAGQHICDIADILQIEEILDVADGGLLSALGMGLAPLREDSVIPVYTLLHEIIWDKLEQTTTREKENLIQRLRNKSKAANSDLSQKLSTECLLELRYAGTDTTLTIPWQERFNLEAAFSHAYAHRFGYERETQPIEAVSIRLSVFLNSDFKLSIAKPISTTDRGTEIMQKPTDPTTQQIEREEILPGEMLHGPVIIRNAGSTLLIKENWCVESLSDGTLLLKSTGKSKATGNTKNTLQRSNDSVSSSSISDEDFDPVFRECYAQRLTAIATQMGLVLQQTAVSVNVKQRRDYSCAIFDSSGQLLANAPHVPVHLGAMGETVRAVLQHFPLVKPGDSFITNDPYQGGSHLPDVTVITPVFATPVLDKPALKRPASPTTAQPVMFVANRAHHADIGGITPGSMSVDSRRVGDEGVVITPRKLQANGVSQFQALEDFLKKSAHPPRSIDQNIQDIAAQLAANTRGAELLGDYAAASSWTKLISYASHLLDVAELRTQQFIHEHFAAPENKTKSPLSHASTCKTSRTGHYKDYLDDGTPIEVKISAVSERSLKIDFTGSGATHPGNFNANPSIVKAAVMYVLRCLVADDFPLNEGVMRCIELVIPEGILNPQPCENSLDSPAVAAGNVETSQRVVDVLLAAFDACAASQGTMNNLLFGNSHFGFYETICGGAGATRGHTGASGVHTHMTNTRLTDPEILEANYPVRLVDFRLRSGSGGAGEWSGGDGVIRTLQFLEPVQVSLLTSRRINYRPFGMHGGEAGEFGQNTLIRSDGVREPLPPCCQIKCSAGDAIELQTPGGGGWGTQP